MEKTVKALFTQVSGNAKTGPIPVTITEKASCWTGCALYEKGCYAFYGALGHFWAGVSKGTRGSSWDERAPESQRSQSGPCGATPRPAICPAPTMRSTPICYGSSCSRTAASA